MAEGWAGRFFDGQRAVAHTVTVAKWADGVTIRSEDGGITLHWQRGSIGDGGRDPDGDAILRHGQAWLLIPAEAAFAMLGARGSRTAWSRLHLGWQGAACVLAASALLAVMLAVVLAPERLVMLVPVALERPLGAAAEQQLMFGKPPCAGKPGMEALRGLTGRLADAAGAGADVHLTVVDAPMVNAFSLPGRRIVLMRGLIDAAGDADEVAGVLAHEMGHIAHRDPTRLLLRQIGLGAFGLLFDAGGSSGVVMQVPLGLAALSYSRAAETAADAAALDYLGRLDLRQDGLHRMLGRLKARENGLSPNWLATHPATDLRTEATRRSETGASALTREEWQSVLQVCG